MNDRVVWELQERVAELEAELAGSVQREQQRERELTAIRHELELHILEGSARDERTAAAEARLADTRADLVWLRRHADEVTTAFGEATAAFDEAREAIAALRSFYGVDAPEPDAPEPAAPSGPADGGAPR